MKLMKNTTPVHKWVSVDLTVDLTMLISALSFLREVKLPIIKEDKKEINYSHSDSGLRTVWLLTSDSTISIALL